MNYWKYSAFCGLSYTEERAMRKRQTQDSLNAISKKQRRSKF